MNFFKTIEEIELGIKNVECVKFLGVHIDSELSWSYQIDSVVKKLNKSYYALLRLKDSLNSNSLLQIYYSTVYSYL